MPKEACIIIKIIGTIYFLQQKVPQTHFPKNWSFPDHSIDVTNPAISTVFPINRILYYISIGSILNIKWDLNFNTPSKSHANVYNISLSFLSLNVLNGYFKHTNYFSIIAELSRNWRPAKVVTMKSNLLEILGVF